MKLNPGDMIVVPRGRHFYSDGWIVGTAPSCFKKNTIVIYLNTEENSLYDERVFWRIFTESGVGIINSTFCEMMM